MAKIKSGKFADFTPTKRNSNKHTMKGMRSLDSSMSEDGYTAPMTAAADGEIIDGDARFEASGNRFNDDVIVIEHDGSKPIVAVRTDIKDAEAPAARRIHYRANLTAWQNLEMDSQVVIEDIKEFDFDFESIGVGLDELGDLLERDIEGLLSGKEAPEDFAEFGDDIETEYCCPKCSYSWSGQPK